MKTLMVAAAVLCLFMPVGGQTMNEQVNTLKNFKDDQRGYNTDEHNRNEKSRVELEDRVNQRLKDFADEQRVQDANIKGLESSAIEIKFLGVILGVTVPLVVTVGMASVLYILNKREKVAASDLIAHDKIRDNILGQLAELQHFKTITMLQMPLMTELAQEMTGMIVSTVHHPDEEHNQADDLLDKVGGPEMSRDDTKTLTALMAQRSFNKNVPHEEREAASRLPKMMSLVKQLIALQNTPATETAYGDRNVAKQENKEKGTA